MKTQSNFEHDTSNILQKISPSQPLRQIKEIIIHCSATDPSANFTVNDIDRWHRQRGWNGIGYHYVVNPDGTVDHGRSELISGAHCYGHNKNSIGICYIGGLSNNIPSDTRTVSQRHSLLLLIKALIRRYPQAKVYGHRDFTNKACPCFDATSEYSQIPEQESKPKKSAVGKIRKIPLIILPLALSLTSCLSHRHNSATNSYHNTDSTLQSICRTNFQSIDSIFSHLDLNIDSMSLSLPIFPDSLPSPSQLSHLKAYGISLSRSSLHQASTLSSITTSDSIHSATLSLATTKSTSHYSSPPLPLWIFVIPLFIAIFPLILKKLHLL